MVITFCRLSRRPISLPEACRSLAITGPAQTVTWLAASLEMSPPTMKGCALAMETSGTMVTQDAMTMVSASAASFPAFQSQNPPGAATSGQLMTMRECAVCPHRGHTRPRRLCNAATLQSTASTSTLAAITQSRGAAAAAAPVAASWTAKAGERRYPLPSWPSAASPAAYFTMGFLLILRPRHLWIQTSALAASMRSTGGYHSGGRPLPRSWTSHCRAAATWLWAALAAPRDLTPSGLLTTRTPTAIATIQAARPGHAR